MQNAIAVAAQPFEVACNLLGIFGKLKQQCVFLLGRSSKDVVGDGRSTPNRMLFSD